MRELIHAQDRALAELAAGRGRTFRQQLDDLIAAVLVPALDRLEPPTCTEEVITAAAADAGIIIGNPVWEGRADLARTLPQASGVVVDLGCGFGTNTVALARSAERVIALDTSADRVALTAARARAEGLENVIVRRASGTQLPVDNASCDLLVVVGVLEWVPAFEAGDPDEVQLRVLREIARVLKPGGVLLLGIENRYGGRYFLGGREEHTDLAFASLLPRRVADSYLRRKTGGPLRVRTHSRRRLRTLVEEAGLTPRFAYPLPSYQWPQLSFDEVDFRRGHRFYARHVFNYNCLSDRLFARASLALPVLATRAFAPAFWVVAAKDGEPAQLPTVVTGRPGCRDDIKRIDWAAGRIERRPRLGGDATSEPLLDGWNARRWVSWPLLISNRRHRAEAVTDWLTGREADLTYDSAPRDVVDRCANEASAGLSAAAHELDTQTLGWCQSRIRDLRTQEWPGTLREHGDLVLANIVVSPSASIREIDPVRSNEPAVAGRDVTTFLFDLESLFSGSEEIDLAVALEALERGDHRRIAGRLLQTLPGLGPGGWESVVILAVLRHLRDHRRIRGIAPFLRAAATGRLEDALAQTIAESP
jgi:SAM-dependent methyltransferase